MSVFCAQCGGDEVIDVFYVDDEKKVIRVSLETCPCFGGHRTGLEGPQPGERKVTAQEAKRLKAEWAILPLTAMDIYQAAA